MRYSVLMSVYKNDNATFLKEALYSIYEGQKRKPDEIVVVFDGPLTAELYAALDEFKMGKEDIVVYRSLESNMGLGKALKIGTAYCTGDYIFRMDADDISAADRFDKQIKYIEINPEVDVLGTGIAEFQASLSEEFCFRICPTDSEGIKEMCKHRNPMNHVSVCIKRSALEACGGYEHLLYLEDYLLWIKMIGQGFVLRNLDEHLVFVRTGNNFINKRGARERIQGWKVLQQTMLGYNMINKREALLNMLYINVFVKMPSWIKKVAYRCFLRK